MRTISFGTTALMGLLALLPAPFADAAAPLGIAPADGSLVLSFKARRGKGPELLNFMNNAADYINKNQPGVLSAYGFKITGKEEYVFVERYDSLENLLVWANSPAHSKMIGQFIPLIDIFSSNVESSVPLFDIIGGLHPAPPGP
ncbi:hypothetical protein BJX63DRAFT_429056 [Aspergillus granulosus]|uniref:ABM domain-containing protein n=1 Tax=Aspergillus granulosus TaxID=176169 RepID=A0ABR4HST5_9EURO